MQKSICARKSYSKNFLGGEFFILLEMEKVVAIIRDCAPALVDNLPVFQELMTFFGKEALIAPDLRDLRDFLESGRRVQVVKISETSLMKCAYALVDNFPECLAARGMLRYYRVPGAMFWQDVEKAENIIANSLTMDVYGWNPDAFTGFEKSGSDKFELTAILSV